MSAIFRPAARASPASKTHAAATATPSVFISPPKEARVTALTKAPVRGLSERGSLTLSVDGDVSVVALRTRQHQDRLEHVDEVEVEAQRAVDRLLVDHLVAVAGVIHLLDRLGVPGGQAGEDDHRENRDPELQAGAVQEQVEQTRDDEADDAHHHE